MDRRKQLVAEYQQQKREMGIYEIVNLDTGRRYIASSLTLETVWGKEQFMLVMGSHTNAGLQQDWNRQGADSFEFHIREVLKIGDEVRKDYKDVNTPEGYRADIAREYKKQLEQLLARCKEETDHLY